MVRQVFADAAYFQALACPRDRLHRQASMLEASPPGTLVTTEWVLAEAANSLASTSTRERFVRLMDRLRKQGDVRIVEADSDYFKRGFALYGKRLDKAWSLTDCISFLVMEDLHIQSALTSDEDFEQAGYKRLMDPGPRGVREPAAVQALEPLFVLSAPPAR